MREKFNKQLQQLYSEVVEMGEICITASEEARRVILDPPTEDEIFNTLCDQLKAYEEEIDHKERFIESLCLRLMLHQQPVASDLRAVTSAHRIISDMERIGDQTLDIAELSKYIRQANQSSKMHLNKLFDESISMVKLSIQAFEKKELQTAYKVKDLDDKVDNLFVDIKHKLIENIQKGTDGELALDILMVAKYLERLGDHSVNIANWVIYSITGEFKP